MAVDKFSISLPTDLLAQVDELARAEGVSRSGVIREATAAYVTARASAAYQAERARRIDEAVDAFDAIAEGWGADERSAIELLRELRGDNVMEPDAAARTGERES
jgi:predicted transcriptional regulator